MRTEQDLDRLKPEEELRERKFEQFKRIVVFDLGLDEYIKYVDEKAGSLGYDAAFYVNLEFIKRIIRFSVLAAYRDVLEYGNQENRNHATAVMNLISRYRSGQAEGVMVGGSTSKAREQISILVQTFRQ